MARVLALLAVAVVIPLGEGRAAGAGLDPSAFETLAEGHTLRFTRGGVPFGAEQFFAGRRSLWQYADGACAEGRWWDEGELVCFSYGPGSERQCWRFETGAAGISVRLATGASAPGALVLELAGVDDRPLACPGPDVGS
jgi:hypothetical protein